MLCIGSPPHIRAFYLLCTSFLYYEIVCAFTVSYVRRNRYLLGQTDQYIREIGLKIEEQREEGRAREEREAANRPSMVEGWVKGVVTVSRLDYVRSIALHNAMWSWCVHSKVSFGASACSFYFRVDFLLDLPCLTGHKQIDKLNGSRRVEVIKHPNIRAYTLKTARHILFYGAWHRLNHQPTTLGSVTMLCYERAESKKS